jgi:predicted glycosyltransferase
MRVLFDLLHPAHYHLFKHVIGRLLREGHEVEIIARQKDCLGDLLAAGRLPHHLIRRRRQSLFVLGMESIKAFRMALKMNRQKRFDFMVGISISTNPAARLGGSVAVMFEDDDAKVVPVFAKLGYPLAHYVVTPRCLEFEKHGKKHLTYPGYHELAYLHPNQFTPDPAIRRQLGVNEGERYFLVRLVSLTAHHDIGARGLSTQQARQIVEKLSARGRVFISAETTVEPDLKQYLLPTPVDRIFDVLAGADLVVGDSQTMTAESAVLGTPCLRCNSFVGRISYLEELEHRYGLTKGFLPADFDKLIVQMEQWLSDPELKQKWAQKRQRMLDECVDVSEWIYDLLTRLYERHYLGKKQD